MTTQSRDSSGRRLSRDEQLLWDRIAQSIQPMHRHGRVVAEGPAERPPPPPVPPLSGAVRPAPPPPIPRVAPGPLDHGDTTAMDGRTAERFRRGRMGFDVRLDLHGMTQERAHHALRAAVERAWTTGQRTLLVITGKGTRTGGEGVLRASVPRWLNDADLRNRVLSFAYAQQRDGGEGALYVLLRRRRDTG